MVTPEILCDAIKDGNNNIIITEESFDFLLYCLDNQKFIQGSPSENQYIIDNYNDQCRKILHQKYVFETFEDGYFLAKRYKYQDKITPWSGEDVSKVYELFKDTLIEYDIPMNLKPLSEDTEYPAETPNPLGITEDGWIICEPEPRPWLIERSLRYDGDYLTISEDGKHNRPWKKEEIENIQKIFDGYEVKENGYYKEELWKEQLSKMNNIFIENYLRKIKIKKL
jgi:hypothetical protein